MMLKSLFDKVLKSLPLNFTSPLVALSRPPMIFSRVLFPLPEGPIIAENSPSSIFKLISRKAFVIIFPWP